MNQLQYLLQHPLVLSASWAKVRSWYYTAEFRPEPDYSLWKVRFEDELSELGSDLANGTYRPDRFKLIPYPKKGGLIRHYVMPTIRDQVAFTVVASLIAPFLESQIPNFVFGNRWHRGIYKLLISSAPETKRVWAKRPFDIGDAKMYEPYRRSHGLFRRVCHWTAASMLGSEISSWRSFEQPLSPDDYSRESLPSFVHKLWWDSPQSQEAARGFWFQSDLQLAYPSMRLSYLKEQLLKLCSFDVFATRSLGSNYDNDLMSSLEGYPADIAAPLMRNSSLRRAVGETLISMLEQIEYEPYEDEKSWLPAHFDQQLPHGRGTQDVGLPTGLGISGLLMNVYLSRVDTQMQEWLSNEAKGKAAFLRFADDLILISNDLSLLNNGIDELWRGIADGAANPVIGRPHDADRSNLRINWSKVKPSSLARSIDSYRIESGWTECENCAELIATNDVQKKEILSYSNWWNLRAVDFEQDINYDAITKSKLGPFVTYLVERLSTIGGDSLFNRFGQMASNRIVQLHELIRYTLDDGQVKDDTRLVFSANRLAYAWLPDESVEPARATIADIRMSVKEALQRAPWKFQLWKAIVRCSARRPPTSCPQDSINWQTDENDATSWLCDSLRDISTKDPSSSWLKVWPERNVVGCLRTGGWRPLYVSFLRMSFWNALAETIRDLKKLEGSFSEQSELDTTRSDDRWSSRTWTFRAMSEIQVSHIASWLCDIETWASVLYNGDEKLDWWELDAIAHAVAVRADSSRLFDSLKTSASFSFAPHLFEPSVVPKNLVLPADSEFLAVTPTLKALLSRNQRLQSHEDLPIQSAWSLIVLSNRDRRTNQKIADELEAWGDSERDNALRVAFALNIGFYLPKTFIKEVSHINVADSLKYDLNKRFKTMNDYGSSRKLITFNSKMEHFTGECTIARLLWGAPWNRLGIKDWRPQPWNIPGVGLPVSIALHMFTDVLKALAQSDFDPTNEHPPREFYPHTWILNAAVADRLAQGRQLQFDLLNLDSDTFIEGSIPWVTESRRENDWEVSPHPAYFLPIKLGLVKNDSLRYRLWCHILTFFFAIEGTENVLDAFLNHGLGVVPFEERWSMRNRIHLPTKVWQILDRVRLWFSRETAWDDEAQSPLPFYPRNSPLSIIAELLAILRDYEQKDATLDDFRWERIDASLQTTDDFEIPRSIRTWNELSSLQQVEHLKDEPEFTELTVRVAQIQATPGSKSYFQNFPRLDRHQIQSVMRQITYSFHSEDSVGLDRGLVRRGIGDLTGMPNNQEGIIVFPELTLPRSEIYSVLDMVSLTGKAALIGTHLHILPTVSKSRTSTTDQIKFVANEALLAVPIYNTSFVSSCLVRQFWIRKPIPAPIEEGLMEALTEKYSTINRNTFRFLRGKRWYRFWHPQWGDFTIAICADIVNPAPWHSMQGQILHLFMCAYNQDVDLFDSMTWVRAYENYINVVSTNHGRFGGSFVWTPKHSHAREVTKLRGEQIFLNADVRIPVKELWSEQRNGIKRSIDMYHEFWMNRKTTRAQYKSPPPGFRGRP